MIDTIHHAYMDRSRLLTMLTPASVPSLWRLARLDFDPVRQQRVLLYPEGVVLLNDTGARHPGPVRRPALDRRHRGPLEERYHCDVTADVIEYLSGLAEQELVRVHSDAGVREWLGRQLLSSLHHARSPEITHRCPLHCPYCSNPLEMIRAHDELTTEEWKRVFSEARELGVLQLGLSGGEPLVRGDVEELAAHARSLGLYTTLVTSGVGLHAGAGGEAAPGRPRAHPDLDSGLRRANRATASPA